MRLPAWLRRRTRLASPAQADTATLERQLELTVPKPAWRWITLAAVLIVSTVAVTMWWLLHDPLSTPAVTARWEAIRTALLAGGGVGAALTLMIAFRRQRQQELQSAVTAELTRRGLETTAHDATERRVTELYTKAVEQLGHATAAVRLGGLYALERLAQDNPDHRQTIVNVICAYLRMPYTPPLDGTGQDSVPAASRVAVVGVFASATGHDPREERQVRLAAQRILAEHLRGDRPLDQGERKPASSRFWENMRVDLTGATLIDLDFTACHLINTQFARATFWGDARFVRATFMECVVFDKAIFERGAHFKEAVFEGEADFGGVLFEGDAIFDGATFADRATFGGMAFMGRAHFASVTFMGFVLFMGVAFGRFTSFARVTFRRPVVFEGVNVENVTFIDVTFLEDAVFTDVTFTERAEFNRVIFAGGARFVDAAFAEDAQLSNARVLRPDGKHAWPVGWVVIRGQDGSGLLQRDDTTSPSLPSAQQKTISLSTRP